MICQINERMKLLSIFFIDREGRGHSGQSLENGANAKGRVGLIKVRLHRRCGPAILPSDAISIENFLSPRN